MPLRNAIILTDAGSGVNTFFRLGKNFFGGRRYARPRKPAGPGIALAAIGAAPLSAPASKLARGKATPRHPFGFPSPAGHESPPAAGHERTAARSARNGALHGETMLRVGRRPFSCPREAGRSCPASDGTRRVAGGGGGAAAGGAASWPMRLPTRTGAAGPSRRRFSWLRAAPVRGRGPHH